MDVGCANCWSMLDLHGGEDEEKDGGSFGGWAEIWCTSTF